MTAADYIRRLVSGNKARFEDGSLEMELDLVYVTDQVLIMGYPAQGFEGLYRNKREDAKKFLEARHGKNFWVFNFCPLRENSYDEAFFDGRVSRYPFPDHHAPPLAILPLAAREMRNWLDGSPERVIVLHCKAGKGRSGTLACSYLLALDELPSAPKLERSYNPKEWAKVRAEEVMVAIPEDNGVDGKRPLEAPQTIEKEKADVIGDTTVNGVSKGSTLASSVTKPYSDTLEGVLALHTSRRMKAPSSPSEHVKQGVSIPSQRRWLYYWSLLLAHEGPGDYWSICSRRKDEGKVRMTEVKLRMRGTSSVKLGLVKVANTLMQRGGGQAPTTHVWVSLARYDDELVRTLETTEKNTRDSSGNMGKRELNTDQSSLFAGGKWDTGKMVRSFARMGAVKDEEGVTDAEKITTYTLGPLDDARWGDLKEELKQDEPIVDPTPTVASSEANSVFEADAAPLRGSRADGIVMEADRELRVKLYMGQVFMGWLWLIPSFHMQPPGTPTRLLLTRKEVDFPLGLGAGIVDVEISMEWLPREEAERVDAEPQDAEGEDKEPDGAGAAVGGAKIGDVVEAKQAAKE